MVNRTSTSRNKNHAEKHPQATRLQPQSPSCDNNGRSGTFARHPFCHLSETVVSRFLPACAATIAGGQLSLA